MTTLAIAKRELFSRPPEEHLPDLPTLRTAALEQKQRCVTIDARDTAMQFLPDGETLRFGEHTVRLNHYALAQLAGMARVPMPLLERLDVPTRAQVLNQTFPRNRRYRTALVDGDRLRCVTSGMYERLWDADVIGEIERWLLPRGFVPAKPTINTDARGTNSLGNDHPALFRSDRDSWMFFYGDRSPGDDGFGGLRRGLVSFNSEVGARSFGYLTFVFREVCANYTILGVSGVKAMRARHTSAVLDVYRQFREDLQEIGASLTTEELDSFERARTTRFVPEGPGEREQSVRRLVSEFHMPEADALEAVDLVRAPENPGVFTVYGIANGITSAAKALPYANDRVERGVLAARVLAVAS